MPKLEPFLIFLVINIDALVLGYLFMNNGPSSDWYLELNKAPWTPSGWVFSVAWTSIMFSYSVFMALLLETQTKQKVIGLFVIQLILNVSWNYLFFNQHHIGYALLNIVCLSILIYYFLIRYAPELKLKSLWILPYALWIGIASSLNFYIYLNN